MLRDPRWAVLDDNDYPNNHHTDSGIDHNDSNHSNSNNNNSNNNSNNNINNNNSVSIISTNINDTGSWCPGGRQR